MYRHPRRTAVATAALEARSGRKGISLLAILLTLVVVALLTVSVASTIVAKRATAERNRAREDFAKASQAIDQCVLTVATSSEFKGLKMEPARKAILLQAMAYYENYVKEHANDEHLPPEVIAAQFHVVVLQAKIGSTKSVVALGQAMGYVNRYKADKVDPESLPSVQECIMKVAPPNEWMLIKGATFEDLPKHAFKVFVALQGALMSYDALNHDYPQAVGPRDDLAAIVKAMAMLQATGGGRAKQALAAYLRAINLLELLAKDRPDNLDYKVRLADCLVGAGKLQKAAKNNDAAAASYQKAVDIRQQLALVRPDDKALAADLATAQKELSKIKPADTTDAAPAKAEAAKTDAAAPVTAEPAAAAETTPAAAPAGEAAASASAESTNPTAATP